MSITGIPSSAFNQNPLDAASKLLQQDFQQIGQDLKSGNMAAAQQDFSTLKNDLQTQTTSSLHHVHNNHKLSAGAGNLIDQNSLLQELNQLGQTLSSGNLSAAQQAYAALQTQSTVQSPVTTISGHHTEPPVYQPPVTTIGGRHYTEPPVPDNPVSAIA
jgi:hypothetical protein